MWANLLIASLILSNNRSNTTLEEDKKELKKFKKEIDEDESNRFIK